MNNLTENDIARATKKGAINAYNTTMGHTMIGAAVMLFIAATVLVGLDHVKATWVFGVPMIGIGFLMLRDE